MCDLPDEVVPEPAIREFFEPSLVEWLELVSVPWPWFGVQKW